MTSLMLVALLVAPAQRADDDPEPPGKKGIVARLVARKATYKLDLQGGTLEAYKKAIAQGTATPIPVEVDLVITNHHKAPVRVRLTGTSPELTLSLAGKGAEEASNRNVVKMKQAITYATLKPGEKTTIPLKTLVSFKGTGTFTKSHHWTEPGDYTLKATFRTRIDLNYDGTNPKGPFNYEVLTPRPITLKVEK